MNREDFQICKDKALALIERTKTFVRPEKNQATLDHLQEVEERLRKGQLYAVIAGEFNQGKSRYGNALLGEDELLPEDVSVSTAVVTVVCYGEKEKITVYLTEDGRETSKQISRAEIPHYVTEKLNPNNSKHARLLLVEIPNEKLKDGLVIADTPGEGSLNIHHTQATYSFLPNADVVFHVSDAFKTLSQSGLNFIRDRIWPHCKQIIFVVTKIDAARNYQEIVANNRRKLAEVLEAPEESLIVIPVSSNCRIAYNTSNDEDDLADSNFPELERAMWRLLNQHQGTLLIARAITDLGTDVRNLIEPLKMEYDAYVGKSKAELDDIQRQTEDALEEQEDLLKHGSRWQKVLAEGMEDARRSSTRELEDRIEEIRENLDRSLESDAVIAEIARTNSIANLANQLQVELSDLAVNLTEDIRKRAEDLYQEVQDLTKLDVSPFELDDLEISKSPIGKIPSRRRKRYDKIMTAYRESSFTRGAGATAGAMIGGVLGSILPGIGTAAGAGLGVFLGGLAGTLVGFVMGAARHDEMTKAQIQADVLRRLPGIIRSARRDLGRHVEDAFTTLGREVREDLVEKMERRRAALSESVAALKRAKTATTLEVRERAAKLRAPLDGLNEIFQAAKQIAIEIDGELEYSGTELATESV